MPGCKPPLPWKMGSSGRALALTLSTFAYCARNSRTLALTEVPSSMARIRALRTMASSSEMVRLAIGHLHNCILISVEREIVSREESREYDLNDAIADADARLRGAAAVCASEPG